MSGWAPLKCAHCVDPIEVRDAVITIGLERFHVTCWHALTRAVSRRGRQASEATRTRIDRPASAPTSTNRDGRPGRRLDTQNPRML
jgi:hypothetical protein